MPDKPGGSGLNPESSSGAADTSPEAVAPTRRKRWARRAEVILTLTVLGWRIFFYPLGNLWRDWAAIIAAYWLYTIFWKDSKAWSQVTAAVMAYLLGIYVYGQLPHILSMFSSPAPSQ